jgi:hypothetical protein
MTQTLDFPNDLMPDDDEFDRMKAQLFDRIEAEEVAAQAPVPLHLAPRTLRGRTSRRTRWITVVSAAAAVAAGALIATNLGGPPAATAQAAEVLHGAALASIRYSDPVVAPGQFLRVETTEVGLGFSDTGAYEQPQRIVLYVPADRSGSWVESRQELQPGKQYGNATAVIADYWSHTGAGALRLYHGAQGDFGLFDESYDAANIAALPQDANQLHDYLYAHVTGELGKDEEVYSEIRDLLITGLVPAKLRAAMYDVVARVPGVYLAAGKANLDGKVGVGISRLDTSGGYIQQFIIDPSTGQLIGVRDLTVKPTGPVPAGVSEDWSSVTTSVVGSAPTGPWTTPVGCAPPGC